MHVIHTGELTISLTDAVQLATEGLGSSHTIDDGSTFNHP